MPKQTKITDSFFKSKASSSSSSSLSSLNDNVSNNFGLSLPIDDVIDENNILDTFINSAINGGVKRNWNIQQLKKTVEDINSEFKPQIEKRTAFWEKEIEKLNNIKTTIRKSSSQLDIDSGDKSQKTLLDYFTKNEKSSQNESNITTIVLESQDVPQDLVIPMLDPRTSDLNITTTNSGTLQFNNTSNTISNINNNNNTIITSNNNSSSDSNAGTGIINTTSEIVNPPSNINENIIITPNNTATNNSTGSSSVNNNIITTSTSSDFLDEEDIIGKPITPGSEMMNTMENEIINLNSNDLDDLLMEDIIQVPSILNVVAPETVKTSEPTSSSPSLSNTSSSSNSNTTNATAGTSTIASNVVNTTATAVVNNTINANNTTISSSTNNNTSNTATTNSINTTTTSIINPTNQITTNQTISNTIEKSPNLEKETSIEETLTTPKKTTRKTTSSKKSTASKKTSKKGSKKRKVQDDDAMLDDDDEYKPSLTDEEDLILDEEIEEDDLENVGKSGKRKRPAAKKIADEDEESLNLLDEEDEPIESKSTSISESNKSTSKTTNKSTSNSTTISNNTITNNTTSSNIGSSGSNNNNNTSSNVKEEDDEDEEEIIETPIKTRSSARKKTRSSGKTIDTTDIHQTLSETIANKSSSKTSNNIGSTTPTSIGNNDIFEESINQSPIGMDDSNEPQTPANTKKKKRTTTTVRRRKKKPSEDGTVSSNYQSDHIDGDSFLSHEDELFVSTNSNTDTSAPSYQFWDYVNSFFPVIKRDRLQLLEIEHSDDDDAFSISKRGKHYTEKWEDENCKLFPHLFKKDQSSPMDHESTNLNTSNNTTSNNTSNNNTNTGTSNTNGINLSSFSNLINVDKGSKQFFSQHNLTQRLLSSLIEERDLVSVDTFSNDNENSNHSLVFDSDEESVDESSRKTTRSTRKSTSGNVAHYSSNVFSSPSLNNNSTSNNINSMLDNFSNSFSILEQQQQHEISEHLKQKLPQLSKTHNQKSNQVLQASNQFKDFEQQLFEPSFDYSTQYLNLFEEKLMSEIKSIGLLSPELQTCDPLWIDEESREDDEICAEIRTLQNKLRQQMEKTNTFRMKILNTVKEKLHEETEIGKKILLFSDMEKKLFPPAQKKR